MDDHSEKTIDSSDLGTWQFLRPGWWFLHAVSIIGLFYLGFLFGDIMFR